MTAPDRPTREQVADARRALAKDIAGRMDWMPTCELGGTKAAIVDQVLRLVSAPLPAVPDGEDVPNWRVVGCPHPDHGTRAVDLNGETSLCGDCRVLGPDGAPLDAADGEDVPARLDAAAAVLRGVMGNPFAARAAGDLSSIAESLRLSSPELRAAVAAALARPTGGEQ